MPEPEPSEQPAPSGLEAGLIERMLAGNSLREAQDSLVASGAKKNAVKAAALRLKKLFAEEDEA